MNLSILYRGPLASCNYGCGYCPFAKHAETSAERTTDTAALARFETWVNGRPAGDNISVLFTPWGEALVRRRYRETLTRLSHLPQVARVAAQTNLAYPLDWLAEVNRRTFALWVTYHPTETTRTRFLARCARLDGLGIRYSVGVVGLREHLAEIEALRRELTPSVYLWVNAFKRVPGGYSAEELTRFTAVDPLFPLNVQAHPSLGKSCRGGAEVISVDGDGTMRRCHFIRTPIGNLYEPGWERALWERPCVNATCGCHIGYVHLDELNLRAVFGAGLLERIPAEPIWQPTPHGMKEFLASLHESGHLVVPPLGMAEPAAPDAAARAVLADMDRAARMNLAGDGDPPALNLPAAWWAARILHRACQFLVCRDAGPEAIARGLGEPCPASPRDPAVDYSVDLMFRFLPDLWTISRHAAPADALGEELTRLARAWPLSSVGVDDLGPGLVVAPFLAHPGLRALYADRIVERTDVSRLGADPRVNDAVAAALGAHGVALCPKVADWLAAATASVPPMNTHALALASRFSRETLDAMKRDFVGKDEVIDLLGVCLVAGENLFILGPPGTAKSALVHSLGRRLRGDTFDYLLTRFTEPNELFGPFDIRRLREGELVTNTEGMLPEASLVFLDELLNANSAILNGLLMALNERVFRRGRETRPLRALMFVGASNHLPEDDSLRALFDRFLLRVHCGPVEPGQLGAVLDAGWRLDAEPTPPASLSFDDLRAVQGLVRVVELGATRGPYLELLGRLRGAGVGISDRRAVKLQRLLAASAVLCGRLETRVSDLWVLRYVWDREEQRELLEEIVRHALAAEPPRDGRDHPRAHVGGEPNAESLARDLEALAARLGERDLSLGERAALRDQLATLDGRCQWLKEPAQREFLAARVAELWARFGVEPAVVA